MERCCRMIPAGYMAKRIHIRPNWHKAPHVRDIYSVSFCQSEPFADYIKFWKHNGYWFFDPPEIIQEIAGNNSIDLARLSLFYYEVFENAFDGRNWAPFKREESFNTEVIQPLSKTLEGYDVATFGTGIFPECSPLSCNSLAEQIPTNSHCLFATFEEAEASLNSGEFRDSEPGPCRIFSVYTLDWP